MGGHVLTRKNLVINHVERRRLRRRCYAGSEDAEKTRTEYFIK